MKYTYEPEGICPMEIVVTLNNDILENVEFNGGGCDGNLKALKKLIIGMNINEIEEKFKRTYLRV
jgi:uncharacterized protein (TIGR03905 family)